MNKQLFEIPAIAMGVLQSKLEKLNAKAKKAGTGDISLVRVGRRTDAEGRQIYIVAVEGEPVKFHGYTFVARLDHNLDPNGDSNIVYSMPGEELAPERRKAAANCDHCGWKRNRKDTFILRKDDTEELIQVGRTCLKDFFGHDPEEVARRAQYIVKVHDTLREASKGGVAYMTNRRHIDLEEFLAHVARSVDEYGWVSTKAASESEFKESSRDDALNVMFDWRPYNPSNSPKPEHRVTAEEAIKFVLTLDPDKSNFNFNMVQMAKTEVIDYKGTGIAAAMIFAYNRSVTQAVERATPKQDLSGSEYVGSIKERLTFNVTVLSSKSMSGQFGPFTMTRMLDDAGNLIVSFGSFEADVGATITIKGTVKRHNDFNGTKQTIINRVKGS